MPTPPRVLFVSKPVVPPFHDGTKCLVRDVAQNLEQVHPVVMGARGAEPLPGVESVEVYSDAGAHAPAFIENARAASFLAVSARAPLWHFVFAPNPRTSRVARLLRAARRTRVVQTIASPPRDFAGVARLLFGDVVVAQSCATAARISEQAPGRRIEVIPPPVAELAPRALAARRALRQRLALPDDALILVYPGDIELSAGAENVAALVEPLCRELPNLVVVFAYREKTPRAPEVARALERRLPERHTRFTAALPDVLALIEEARAVLFPVDDLWGKVDMPIVLLESMRLGVPVLALDQGPLRELGGTVQLPAGDRAAWVGAVLELCRDDARVRQVVEAQRAHIAREHDAKVVARRYERLYLELLERSGR
ncbi:MAG: glycosyltransferase family 4 protein [Myxococcales bacterium]|nr:glycosyltransferase family 4 protein [Myxococcales bacterium]